MAGLLIKQEPFFKFNAAGQPLVYTVEAEDIVLNESNVKFICSIWGGRTLNDLYKLATLKTTPNGMGVGMFDVSSIVESYVSPTYQGKRGLSDEHPNATSKFKGVQYSDNKPHTIHQIDKFCTNTNNMFMYEVYFTIEYLDPATGFIVEDDDESDYRGDNLVYNAVLGNHQNISSNAMVPSGQARFGYQPQDFQYASGDGDYLIRDTFGSGASFIDGGKFVTNMPMFGQKIREDDYATIAFFNCIDNRNSLSSSWQGNGNLATCPTTGGGGDNNIPGIALRFKDENGVIIQNNYYENTWVNGGADANTGSLDSAVNLVYFGYGLANMKGRNETWPANSASYDVYPSDGTMQGIPTPPINNGNSQAREGTLDFGEGESIAEARNQSSVPPCECERCEDGTYKCGTSGCIYVDEEACLKVHPIPSWDCIDSTCQDPGTGLGTYTDLAVCQANCGVAPTESWDCIDNNCVDPGGGQGQYSTFAQCSLYCGHHVPKTWDCINDNCYEVFTGLGQYGSLASCQLNCYVKPPCYCVECQDPEPPGKWKCTTDGIDGACIYNSFKDCELGIVNPPPEPPTEWYKPIGRMYNFGIIGDDCHGFESVRIVWQNRMGAWDYYTFTKKTQKKVKTKGVTFNQLGGTWNESVWQPHDHLGGNKIFINKTTTSYDLNTDYVTEDIAAWFEEMFTSSDVYLMGEFTNDEPVPNFGGPGNPPNYLRKYIQPITVGSKSYTKKTRANDNLIKYKFKVDLCIPDNIQKA
tara:strand:- start:1494 stop:3749 length:2256 start_codon:yes stop_codon:yes gene_type:complete